MEPDEKWTPIERLAKHGGAILAVVAVLFVIAIVFLFVSLSHKFG